MLFQGYLTKGNSARAGCVLEQPATLSPSPLGLLEMTPCHGEKCVLVVEDNEATREAFGLILHASGYRVVTASNGQAALEQLQGNELPCLIVLDLTMPVMDGWQFRAVQRQDHRTAHIPVIVCSAVSDTPHPEADPLAAVAYLRKPIDAEALLQAVGQNC